MKQIKLVLLLVVFLISIIYLEVVKVQIVFLNYLLELLLLLFFYDSRFENFSEFFIRNFPKEKKNDLCIPKVMIKLDA